MISSSEGQFLEERDWLGPAETQETQDSFQERILGLEPTLERALGLDSKTSHHTPPVFLRAHEPRTAGLTEEWPAGSREPWLDRGWTLSRHQRIPELQLSPVVSGRSTGRWQLALIQNREFSVLLSSGDHTASPQNSRAYSNSGRARRARAENRAAISIAAEGKNENKKLLKKQKLNGGKRPRLLFGPLFCRDLLLFRSEGAQRRRRITIITVFIHPNKDSHETGRNKHIAWVVTYNSGQETRGRTHYKYSE